MKAHISGRQFLPCAFLLLAACSGGSGSGGGGNRGSVDSDIPPVLPTSDDVLLPFVTGNGELKAVDPAHPSTAPITIDTGLDPHQLGAYRGLHGGSYDDSANAVDNPSMGAMVYVKAGRVYRVNLARGASTAPVQITSVSEACSISDAFEDFANPLHSRVFIATAVSWPDCSLTVNYGASARLDEGASADPAGPMFATGWTAIRGSDGSIAAWLAVDDASHLNRYDANLSNPVLAATLEARTWVAWPHSPVDRHTMYAVLTLPGEPAPCLHRYDASANTLSGCLHSFESDNAALAFPRLNAADATHEYFADGTKAWRVAHDGTTAELLADHGSGVTITNFELSENRLVVASANYGTGQYRITASSKVPLSADDSPVAGLDVTSSTYMVLNAVAGPWVYYTQYSAGNATRARDDATVDPVTQYGEWGPFSVFPTRTNLGGKFWENPYHIQLAAGSTLSSIDAQTGATLHALGSPADSDWGFDFRQSGSAGRYRLTEIRIVHGGTSSDTDVFLMDTLTPDSLQPVGATAGANDRIVR